MASPNTLARNAALAHLKPSRIPVEIERTPKTAVPGEFAAMLREYARIKNKERAVEGHARNRGRDIPTCGPGRRRAKAIRNRDTVLARAAEHRMIARARRHRDAGLLAGVLDWCSAHPYDGPLPEPDHLDMYLIDGEPVVKGEPPAVLVMTGDLLDTASSEYLAFTDGVLTMAVQPRPLRYRPLAPHPGSRVVAFEYVRDEDEPVFVGC